MANDISILIVDEVLAVGDVEFQKKCLGRMKEVGRTGRTVLLVSHNMSAITSLCKRAIWIDDGKVQENGPVVQVVSSYLSSVKRPSGKWYNEKPPEDDSDVRILAAYCRSNGGEIQSISHFGEALTLEIHYEIIECIVNLWILIRISDALGNVVFSSADVDSTGLEGSTRDRGRFCSTCKIPKGFLRPGEYTLSIMAMEDGKKLHAYHENVLKFEISDVGYPFTHLRKGVITPMLAWEVKRDKCSNTG
jgi:lipopolysaccharide transport system ATP-binding protein